MGGFSASPYLQQRAKAELGGLLAAEPGPTHAEAAAVALAGGSTKAADTARLLIPFQPAAAVVVGEASGAGEPPLVGGLLCVGAGTVSTQACNEPSTEPSDLVVGN